MTMSANPRSPESGEMPEWVQAWIDRARESDDLAQAEQYAGYRSPRAALQWAADALSTARERADRAEREVEAVADRVFKAGVLDPNDGDTDSADPADWIISAVEHLERRSDDKIEALQRVVVRLADAHLSGERLPDLSDAEHAVIATARNEVREYDDLLRTGMDAATRVFEKHRRSTPTPTPDHA